MKVTNITRYRDGQPCPAEGVLKVTELGPTHIEVEHYNDNDGYYWYKYDVTGSTEEIRAVKSFCDQLTEATAATPPPQDLGA